MDERFEARRPCGHDPVDVRTIVENRAFDAPDIHAVEPDVEHVMFGACRADVRPQGFVVHVGIGVDLKAQFRSPAGPGDQHLLPARGNLAGIEILERLGHAFVTGFGQNIERLGPWI